MCVEVKNGNIVSSLLSFIKTESPEIAAMSVSPSIHNVHFLFLNIKESTPEKEIFFENYHNQ